MNESTDPMLKSALQSALLRGDEEEIKQILQAAFDLPHPGRPMRIPNPGRNAPPFDPRGVPPMPVLPGKKPVT